MNLLVTGGCGFIGSHFIRRVIGEAEIKRIINVDCLTYAGRIGNLEEAAQHRKHFFVQANIRSTGEMLAIVAKHHVSHVVHLAAESHVDRSIEGPGAFLQTNVIGTFNLLEACRKHPVEKFLHVSTDEVYGSIEKGSATEISPLNPSSPYAASKAAADMLCLAYGKTYGLPIIVTRCVNNYGPNQYPEKLLPVVIKKALSGERIPVYGDGSNVRDWIHACDHCEALWNVLKCASSGSVFNIAGRNEISNLELVKKLCRMCDADESLIEFVTDRPGHDFRYSVRGSNPAEGIDFEDGLRKVVGWYRGMFSSPLRTNAGQPLNR